MKHRSVALSRKISFSDLFRPFFFYLVVFLFHFKDETRLTDTLIRLDTLRAMAWRYVEPGKVKPITVGVCAPARKISRMRVLQSSPIPVPIAYRRIALRLHCEFLEIAERKKAMECNQEKKRRVRVQKNVGCHFVSLLLLDWPIGLASFLSSSSSSIFFYAKIVCVCVPRVQSRELVRRLRQTVDGLIFFLEKNRGCRMLSVSLTGTIQRQAKKMNRKEKNLGWLCCVCQKLEKKLVYSPSACITFFYPFSLLCNRILLYAITQRPKMGWHTRAYPHCT